MMAAVHESAHGTAPTNQYVRIHGEYWRVTGPLSLRIPALITATLCRAEKEKNL
jgi:hypothetical protein